MPDEPEELRADLTVVNSDEAVLEDGTSSLTVSTEESLLSMDDVFLPNPVKMTGVDDYNAIRDSLSWTQSTQFWPDVDETNWVVLSGNAVLASGQNVVAVVKDANTTVTVTSGTNLIFADTSSLTINQSGGKSDVYYDPSKDIELEINVYDGFTALSSIQPNFSDIEETLNSDGSRSISTNKAKINYNTSDSGSLYLNDVMTGQITQTLPTDTLSKQSTSPIVSTNDDNPDTVNGPLESRPSGGKIMDEAETTAKMNVVPNVYTEALEPLVFEEESQSDEISELDTLFDDDVLIDAKMTEVAQDYLREPIIEEWQLRSENFVTNSSDNLELAFTKQADQIATSKDNQEFTQKNEETLDDVLAMQSWDDLIVDDLMDLFYGE
ncbi:hypothetical protein N8146_01060 [Ascidiaceihabitans sp.]|nr:hypothetical protein [Ascidiaceihabitans sp.]